MSSLFVSTDAVYAPTRLAVMRIQKELARAQSELATGLQADTGLTLSGNTAVLSRMQQQQAWNEAIASSNQLGAARLEFAQTALAGVSGLADDFLKQLIAAKGGIASSAIMSAAASHGLRGLVAQLNTEVAGVYVFAGDNAADAPVADYFADSSPARAAVSNAFEAAFGMAPSSPGVSAITLDQMNAFLEGTLPDLFSDAGWASNWSSASAEGLRIRISDYETVEAGANANDKAFRDLAQAFVMTACLGGERLEANVQKVIIDKAAALVSSALAGVATVQSRLGLSQGRIDASDTQLTAEGLVLAARIADMRHADPYEAASAINTLTVQLQSSYAATARLQAMSLANYL